MNFNFIEEARNDELEEGPRTLVADGLHFPGAPLQFGSCGKHVRMMQRYLNSIARAFYPQLPLLKEDGRFDNLTAECVRDYQSLSNLEPDSIIGPTTWNSIVSERRAVPFSSEISDLPPISPMTGHRYEADLRCSVTANTPSEKGRRCRCFRKIKRFFEILRMMREEDFNCRRQFP